MKTNEIVISKVKSWLKQNKISYQVLANELGISKSLVGHMLSGERTLLPERIAEISEIMGIPVIELIEDESFQMGELKYQLRGSISNRASRRELEALLFSIEDYMDLKEQVK